ncbi:sensor histidine kinase [Phaeovulum sp.]|uniref:sensor histidine kinase n=1 Tax=Phaeovulum sp. TaxID=2934796 RepID=UPI00356A06B6
MDTHFLDSLLNALPQPSLLIDASARISAANSAAQALFGHKVVGHHYTLALRQPGPLAAIEAALAEARETQAQHIHTGPSRETVYRMLVRPVAGDGRRAVLASFEDVSEAQQIGQFRRDFVANVSHELRTPLTSLLGFIETLRGPAKDDAQARERFLTVMAQEAERMNRLVRDLLHLSRVEAEERVRPTTQVDLASLLASVVRTLRPMADAAGATIVQHGEPGPALLPADADQLTQVFQNLIENAVKYGAAKGTVTVTLRQVSRDVGLRTEALAVDVRDEGEGIPAEHIPRLSERFYRVDSHRSRAEGGTGLGLAIVKHIVQRHRGRLVIASAPGKGSTFTVVLPTH